MPELPEVHTVAVELDHRLTGRSVVAAEVLWSRTVAHPAPDQFVASLTGQRVTAVSRRAKYILIHLDGGACLVIHLRMTGRITIVPASASRDPHTRIVLRLDGGAEMRFADTRKFGRMYLVPAGEAVPVPSYASLGPEPLEPEFTPDVFAACVSERRGNVKAALLSQTLVAGLGNIYVDEALFAAQLHPRRTLQSLRPREVSALHGAIVAVLSEAVRLGGTSFSDYRTTWGRLGGYQQRLAVFRRAGAPCARCGAPIVRELIAGRGTHFCPVCQK